MTLFPSNIDAPSVGVTTRERPGSVWIWCWMGLACVALFSSGAVRFWEERRSQSLQVQTADRSFPLKSLDETVGRWQTKESAESALDPQIARIAGSSDSLIRTYVDKETGVSVVVLILYGRAGPLTAHTPEVCYESQGYDQLEVFDFDLQCLSPRATRFRSLLFTKKGGRDGAPQEVLYAFRNEGLWSPVVQGRRKTVDAGPPIFKIMVQRQLAERERRNVNNPCALFLSEILPTLERRIRDAEQAQTDRLTPAT